MVSKRVAVALVISLAASVGGCGNDGDSGSGSGSGPLSPMESTSSTLSQGEGESEAPFFVPPKPLSREQFNALVRAAGVPALRLGETPAQRLGSTVSADAVARYRQDLCNGQRPLVPVKLLSTNVDLPAYAAIFDDVGSKCLSSLAVLAWARGDVAWSVAHNELRLASLLRPQRDAADRFCAALDETEQLTAPLIAEAASQAGLARGPGAGKAVEIGVGILIKGCPMILDALG